MLLKVIARIYCPELGIILITRAQPLPTAILLIDNQAKPEGAVEGRYQGKRKTICWLTLVKTDKSGPFLFEGTNSPPIRLTQDSYLNLLEIDVNRVPKDYFSRFRRGHPNLH